MSRGLTSALALLLLGSLGCKPKKVTIHNSTTYPVEVFWGEAGAGDADEVDFDDPRLEKALADTERLVGHRVDVSFDVALLPRPRGSFFEQMFDRQVGRIPLELAEMKDHDPELFAQFAPSLKKIVFGYDGARRHMEVEFNPKSGALTYVLTYADIGRGSVSFAARQAQQKAVDARFAGRSVGQIPAAELAAYAQWVVDRNHAGEDVLQPMVELLEIWAHVSKAQRPPQDVLSVVRRAVPRHASYLASEYRDRAEGRAASEWLDQAGREYGRFVAAEFAVLTDDAKANVLRSLFPKHTRRGGDRYIRDAYPGLDRVRFGLGLAQQWLSAGAPERFGEGDAAGPLTDLVCPRGAGERPLDSAYCRGQESLWDFASYDEAARKQIAQAIVSVNDPRFTLTALVGMRDVNANGMVDVWHRLEKQPKHWLIGARALGDRIHYDSNRTLARELYDEAVGSWRGHPERRAGYLYILAAHEYPRSSSTGMVAFDAFGETFGGPIDARTFQEFLRVSDGAYLRVPAIWPALRSGAGTSSVPSILEQLLDHGDEIAERNGFRQMDVVGDWLRVLRDTNDTASSSAAHSELRARLRKKPSEASSIRAYIGLTEPRSVSKPQ